MNEHIQEYEVQKLGEIKAIAFKSSHGNFLLSITKFRNIGIFLSLQPNIS